MISERMSCEESAVYSANLAYTVRLGGKEQFDKEQIGVKEPFPMTNCQFTS